MTAIAIKQDACLTIALINAIDLQSLRARLVEVLSVVALQLLGGRKDLIEIVLDGPASEGTTRAATLRCAGTGVFRSAKALNG